jgi:serine/threonine protein kinase
MTLAAGTKLGPYEILAPIGAGGMGEVYKAKDTRLGRDVAVKVLPATLSSSAELRQRLDREAKTISALSHPHICALFDVGRENDTDYLVMEFLEGETLAVRLTRGPGRSTRGPSASGSEAPSAGAPSTSPSSSSALPPMSVDEALRIAIPIASALDRAHRQGIVHRDLKPGNVMLTKGAVKLLDFGLARLTRAGGARDGGSGDGGEDLGRGLVSLADLSMPTMGSPLTMKGVILGTLQYMSPEQIEGKDIDARTDIFAFGAVLYEMLTGRRPFEGKSQASLIGAILDHDPPRVMSLLPTAPPMLDEIVARCLAKDPDERWQSARDVMCQLEWVATRNAAWEATVIRRRRRRAAGVIVFWASSPRSRRRSARRGRGVLGTLAEGVRAACRDAIRSRVAGGPVVHASRPARPGAVA